MRAKTSTPKASDHRHMAAALALAARGLGNVAPNPAVGCVIVRPDLGDRIVGRGWTQPSGRPHAETEALRRAGSLAVGATAYVSLEPCSHTGETGPCVDALVAAGIKRCVVAVEDPDPRVSGSGVGKLKSVGVSVDTGEMAAEAEALNSGFFSCVGRARPTVGIKLATTLDGQVATTSGASQWITGAEAREYGHLLRARHDAIVTGIGTVLADDPQLNCRLPGMAPQSPNRVILDTEGRLPETAAVIAGSADTPTWRYTLAGSNSVGTVETIEGEPDVNGRLDIGHVLADLADRGITRLLVEAGPELTTSFFTAGLVDTIYWFRAPSIIGGDGKSVVGAAGIRDLADTIRFRHVASRSLGDDKLEIYTRRDAA